MKKLVFAIPVAIVGIFAVATVGASFYMLDYSLAPDSARRDTAFCFRELRRLHPEVTPWLDSLKAGHSLRDTFVVMPTGERHHAYYALNGSSHTAAIVIHGWRDCAIDFFDIARLYHQQHGCHVLMPDLHAHGLSEGDAVGMGWHDRLDILQWMEIAHNQWGADTIIVHGVSMGAATAMNVAGETMPSWLKSIRFIEDCGYTSVWDEFGYQLRQEFGLPAFPLLYTTSLLCKLKYGWSFGEASSLNKIQHSPHPMLFIHGDSDDFVPTFMVHQLYRVKPQPKRLWITKGAQHALSYTDYPEDYARQIKY
ncbi:MAG: alpha/beta fold hydrolase [Prevotella sp.]|nr:alpha/beta fold hydrolase [Prevotella sp.]